MAVVKVRVEKQRQNAISGGCVFYVGQSQRWPVRNKRSTVGTNSDTRPRGRPKGEAEYPRGRSANVPMCQPLPFGTTQNSKWCRKKNNVEIPIPLSQDQKSKCFILFRYMLSTFASPTQKNLKF